MTWTPDVDAPDAEWTVQLTKFDCGRSSLPDAAENPEFFDDYEAPEFIDAKAASGEEFCVVKSSWKDTGKTPETVDTYGDLSNLLLADNIQHAASEEDLEYSGRLSDSFGVTRQSNGPRDTLPFAENNLAFSPFPSLR